MKMKQPKLWSLALGLLSTVASAGTATGVGGGGNTIDVNGRPSLRDLVDTTLCSWVSGDAMESRLPYLPNIYRSLDRFDPIYAQLLQQEAQRVTFCLTDGDLVQVKTEDQDGLTIFLDNTRQVAIRLNDTVYIDRKILGGMDERNQAYLFVHELMHAFIPVTVTPQSVLFLSLDSQLTSEYAQSRYGISLPQRNMKLRSFIKTLSDNELQPLPLNEFLLQVRMNHILWPSTPADLETLNANRSMIQAATSPSSSIGSLVVTTWKLQTQPARARHWLAAAEPTLLQRLDLAWSPWVQGSSFTPDCHRLTEGDRYYVHAECFDPTGHQPSRYLNSTSDLEWIIRQLSVRLTSADFAEVLRDEAFMATANRSRGIYYFDHPIVGRAQSDERDGKLTDRQLENLRVYLEMVPVDLLPQVVTLPSTTEPAPRTLAVIRSVFVARGLPAPKPVKRRRSNIRPLGF